MWRKRVASRAGPEIVLEYRDALQAEGGRGAPALRILHVMQARQGASLPGQRPAGLSATVGRTATDTAKRKRRRACAWPPVGRCGRAGPATPAPRRAGVWRLPGGPAGRRAGRAAAPGPGAGRRGHGKELAVRRGRLRAAAGRDRALHARRRLLPGPGAGGVRRGGHRGRGPALGLRGALHRCGSRAAAWRRAAYSGACEPGTSGAARRPV